MIFLRIRRFKLRRRIEKPTFTRIVRFKMNNTIKLNKFVFKITNNPLTIAYNEKFEINIQSQVLDKVH